MKKKQTTSIPSILVGQPIKCDGVSIWAVTVREGALLLNDKGLRAMRDALASGSGAIPGSDRLAVTVETDASIKFSVAAGEVDQLVDVLTARLDQGAAL
jgi:hypothetical protein